METKKLYDSIIEGVFRKKGKEVIEINLTGSEHAFCNYFIICHGESNTQVKAIADSVEKKVKEDLDQTAWHKEGTGNSHWVLLDFSDIVVHIFQKPYREFYNLEDLWADGKIQKIEDLKATL